MLNRFHPLPLLRRHWQRGFAFVVGVCLTIAIAAVQPPTIAQTTVSQGVISEILDGTQVYIQNNQAQVNDRATSGQQVRTGTARAQVTFNTGAIARLSTNSVLTIGQCAQLQRGTLLVNGAVNGCTSSVTAGVRGTTYVLSVDETGQEQIKVLEGEVVVSRRSESNSDNLETNSPPAPPPAPASPPTSPLLSCNRILGRGFCPPNHQSSQPSPEVTTGDSVVLSAGQEISTRRGERLGIVENLTADDFMSLLSGQLFDGFLSELPGLSRIRDAFQRLYPAIPFPLGGRSILPF